MNENKETQQVLGEGHAIAGANQSESGGVGTFPSDGGGKVESLAKLSVTPEHLKQAVEAEIDKIFDDIKAAAKANFHQALIVPLTRRERRLAKRSGR